MKTEKFSFHISEYATGSSWDVLTWYLQIHLLEIHESLLGCIFCTDYGELYMFAFL